MKCSYIWETHENKCYKILNKKGQTMTPCGNWWYDEWSPKFNDLFDIDLNPDTFYTDTISNAGNAIEGQEKGVYYNIIECESDGRGDVTPTGIGKEKRLIKCYYDGVNEPVYKFVKVPLTHNRAAHLNKK